MKMFRIHQKKGGVKKMLRKEMKGLWVVAVVICFLMISAHSHGSVIYQYVEESSGAIIGELEFLDSVANASHGWTAPAGNLSTLLQGGISGFRWDFGFGMGLESASSGDLVQLYAGWTVSSTSGTSLDVDGGNYGGGEVVFPNGSFVYLIEFGEDQVYFGQPPCFNGDFVLQSQVIPEPSTLVLFGLGFLGLVGYVVRRKRRK